MAIYTYVATDSAGRRRTGTVDAASTELAVTLLKNEGLYVIELERKKEDIIEFLINLKGVSNSELVNFTRQFSIMMTAGLPMSRALQVLVEQTTNKKMKSVIVDVQRDVEGGSSLSNAFGRYAGIFSPTYQTLVRAGESSGKLDIILNRLADTLEENRELSSKFKGAMIYPVIVLFAMVGVFVVMMIFVVPKLAEMYKSLNVDLPFATRVMISMSDFFVHFYLLLFLGVVGAVFAFKTFAKTATGQDILSTVAFKIPVFGKINKQKEITQFTRTLSLLVASAIPIVEALNIVSGVAVNKFFKEAAVSASKQVEKGGALSDYFKKNKLFPPILGQMTLVGEETGQLDTVLEKVAVYFDNEVSHTIKGLSAALEPLILVLLGGMVGVLIISIITPIYKLTSSI